jgi:hypothetical protein
LHGIGAALAGPSVLALVIVMARDEKEQARGMSLFIAVLLASGNRAATIARARELLGLATPAAEEAVEIDSAAAQPLAQPCPCCGGRMFVIETFDAGCQPRHRPTAPLVAIRIDTS